MTRHAFRERSWRWFAEAPMRLAATPGAIGAASLDYVRARIRRSGGASIKTLGIVNPSGVQPSPFTIERPRYDVSFKWRVRF